MRSLKAENAKKMHDINEQSRTWRADLKARTEEVARLFGELSNEQQRSSKLEARDGGSGQRVEEIARGKLASYPSKIASLQKEVSDLTAAHSQG